jgi:class 3 adenylate cyclase
VTIGPVFPYGPTSFYLGLLASSLRRWREAVGHFEDALEMCARLGSRPFTAYAQQAYADALLASGEPAARTKALELLARSLETGRELGMKALVERALASKLRAQGVDSLDITTSIDAVASAVQRERPDLRSEAAPDGTVTILFSDIEGFTPIAERLGDRRAQELLSAHNRLLRQQIREYGGFEVKSQGDGFMIAFQSARRALQCAIAMQQAISADRAQHAETPLRIRVGLHTGETIREADDFFGKTVILAARIAAHAQGGEILVSSLLKELTESAGDLPFGEPRRVALKGLSGTYRIHPVAWSEAGG